MSKDALRRGGVAHEGIREEGMTRGGGREGGVVKRRSTGWKEERARKWDERVQLTFVLPQCLLLLLLLLWLFPGLVLLFCAELDAGPCAQM